MYRSPDAHLCRPFFAKDSKPAFIVVVLMGLQHMLAMLVGVITPPRLLANEGCLLGRDADLCAMTPFLICSALLASGLLSILQIMRVRLCKGYYFGTGLISVMGPSFTFLPIGQSAPSLPPPHSISVPPNVGTRARNAPHPPPMPPLARTLGSQR